MDKTRVEAVTDALHAIDPALIIASKDVIKNNDEKLTALTIGNPGETVVPTIYLERFNGMTEEDAAEKIMDLIRNVKPINFDAEEFANWDTAKKHLAVMLLNKRYNKELLSDMPYKTIAEDLAEIVIYEAVSSGSSGTIKIHDCHREKWGVSEDELLSAAEENAPKMLPAMINGMQDILSSALGEEEAKQYAPAPEQPELTVITNTEKTNGAAVMAYPGVLNMIAKRIAADKLVILPSSIHEVLALPLDDEDMLPAMTAMVREVNANEVADNEILSDHVYIYDAVTDTISVPKEDMKEMEL